MMLTAEQQETIKKELFYRTSRSGGKGGQAVNKIETKVEIIFDPGASHSLDSRQKAIILEKIAEPGPIRFSAEKHRSQLENKSEAQQKLFAFLNKLLRPQKKRVKTKKPRSAKLKTLADKKFNSDKKALRQKPR